MSEFSYRLINKSTWGIVIDFDLEVQRRSCQDEGLYCGLLEWASKQFNFVVPLFEIHFNKEKNKYDFFNIPSYVNELD